MLKLIATVLAILSSVGKFFLGIFSAKARAKKKAVKDGKTSVDNNDTSGIVSSFDRLRK